MTIDEKREALIKYCHEHADNNCNGCAFCADECCCVYDRRRVDESYDIVFNGEQPKEAVNHPSHYQGKNECIDVMVAMFGVEAVKHFCMCNAYKYRFRADKKNGAEDIAKAEWYESKLIELGGVDGESKTG